MRLPAILLLAIVSLITVASCGERRNESRPGLVATGKVLAMVNGVPITDSDLRQRSKNIAAGGPTHDLSGNVLQTLVREELIYQRGVKLGLDQDEQYRLKVDDLEAQIRAFRRQEMAALYRRHVQQQAAVTDEDAQKFFDQNVSFIQTKFHVRQIFYKGKHAEILKDQADLKAGVPFEQVASRRFPELPAGTRPPWDLGELHWFQVPPAWRGVVDRLGAGQASDVIQGEGDRRWIIQLVGKTVDPAITFATEKDRIKDSLRQQNFVLVYESQITDLKQKAKIVYAK